MRYLLIFIITILFSSTTFAAEPTQTADSLMHLVKNSKSPLQKIQLYRNLADIFFNTPQEKEYLLKVYEEAKSINHKISMVDALNDIILNEAKSYQRDSIVKYVGYIKKIVTPEESLSLLPFYNMRFFDTLCYLNKSTEAINSELDFLDSTSNQESDPYREAALNYTIGTSFYVNREFKKTVPYLEKAMKIAETFPSKEKYIYKEFIAWRLCYTYAQSGKGKEAVSMMENLIQDLEASYKINYQKQRPFYKINTFLLQYYSFMITSLPHLTIKQETFYWNRILKIEKHLTSLYDRYNFYHCVGNYYANNHTQIDYPKAISANDSLLKIAEILAPKNLPGLYQIKSVLYEKSKNYPKALAFLKISHHINDSLTTEDAKKQLNELQVKYDINALNNKNAMLEIKNKQNFLISLSILLIIVIVICTYLYFSLKKEKKMKGAIKYLHLKAQESEKMKQEFINSICHEIRTPLNAIVGFSDLITNEDIDLEMRQEFPAEIQKNTVLLTDLVNSMLEVANLDVSKERLPCEQTDLRSICMAGMDRQSKKAGIDYRLNIPEENTYILTNAEYLTQVFDHLLNNANKFTQSGCIALDCKFNEADEQIYIYVTDTGCGIPKEKHEEVFQRFSKLNTFVPGNGLGLYLCQLIVKRLGGEIRIDEHYTTGTRVIVCLPMK